MKNHTPGPWRRSGWAVLCKNDTVVCEVLPWDTSGASNEDHANARLIAAAPELLEVLQSLVTKVGSDEWFTDWSEEAAAVIARATMGDVEP